LKYVGDDLSQIEIRYHESDEYHILSIKDDGIVIKEEDSDKIFGPFVRKQNSNNIQRSGVGLTIIKEIAEQYRGGAEYLELEIHASFPVPC
jgi:signal transduction histidine kinase